MLDMVTIIVMYAATSTAVVVVLAVMLRVLRTERYARFWFSHALVLGVALLLTGYQLIAELPGLSVAANAAYGLAYAFLLAGSRDIAKRGSPVVFLLVALPLLSGVSVLVSMWSGVF